ncbi:hypothetical protein E5D57_007896 [Metarhizium anisopliae]|nr:hypothetical protein E5D57_007896 [Metarhizium anisopliae]
MRDDPNTYAILRSSQARGATLQISFHAEGGMDGRTPLALTAGGRGQAAATQSLLMVQQELQIL